MNSFRFLEKGLRAEIARQEALVRGGGSVEQETLHFDPRTETLTPLRSKEEAHDYRYFPEPDLVPLAPTDAMLERARSALPELPAARAERFERELALPPETARLLAFRSELGDYFEAALAAREDGGPDRAAAGGGVAADPDGVARTAAPDPRALASWVTVELVARVGEGDPADSRVEPSALAELVGLVSARSISGSAAKEVLDAMAASGGRPAAIVKERGLGLAAADELEEIVARAIDANADAVEKVRAGKGKAMGAIVGAVMRETKGRADGGEVQRMVRERLGLT